MFSRAWILVTAREIASLVTELYAKEEIDSGLHRVQRIQDGCMTPNLVTTKLLPSG